jgi:hypothetical protein
MPWSKVEETLLHEVMHAVSDSEDARLSERQVTLMAKGLYSVLKNNKINFVEITNKRKSTNAKSNKRRHR